MEITETPLQYTPAYNHEKGTYEDTQVYTYTNGVVCPCTPLKTFLKKDSFHNHWKCKKHKLWLHHLNENSINYYKECLELRTTVKQQRILLTELETKIASKDAIIKYLESKEKNYQSNQLDLMSFD